MFVFGCPKCQHINYTYKAQLRETYICHKCHYKINVAECQNLLHPAQIEKVIIELGGSECKDPMNDDRFFFLKYYRPGNKGISTGELLDTEDLVALIKGLTICEGNFSEWKLGSASVVWKPFMRLVDIQEGVARQLAPWIRSHTENDYTHMYIRIALENAYWKSHPEEHMRHLEWKKTETERNRKSREIRRAKEKAEIQKVHQERIRKQTIKRNEFLDKLENLSIKDQIRQLAYDEFYPPEAYPDSLAEQATSELLEALEQELLVSLKKKCDRKLRRQWGLFKKRVIEINREIETRNREKIWVKLFTWFRLVYYKRRSKIVPPGGTKMYHLISV